MNYIIYCKHAKNENRFGAMDLSTGAVGVGLMFATLIPDLEKAKGYANQLAAGNPDHRFQVRLAGKAYPVYSTEENPRDADQSKPRG